MAAVMGMPPLRASTRATYPMRPMLVSRSSREKPSPFDRWVRISSPSRTSAVRPRCPSSARSRSAMVDFPAPESPVSQTMNPRPSSGISQPPAPADGPVGLAEEGVDRHADEEDDNHGGE